MNSETARLCIDAMQVYAAPLVDGTRAVVLLNRHTPFPYSTNMTVQFSWLGYHADSKVGCPTVLL